MLLFASPIAMLAQYSDSFFLVRYSYGNIIILSEAPSSAKKFRTPLFSRMLNSGVYCIYAVKGGRERCAGGVQRHSRRQEHCSQGEQARPHWGHDLQVLGI